MAFSCVEFDHVFDDTILHGVGRGMCNDEPVHWLGDSVWLGMRRAVNEAAI